MRGLPLGPVPGARGPVRLRALRRRPLLAVQRGHRDGRLLPCSAETWQPATGQGACRAAETCSGTEYEIRAPTATSDRVCASHAVCSTLNHWESKAAGTDADRECSQCPPGYKCDGATKTACSKGYYQPGTDADLTSCKRCAKGQ